KQKKQCILSGKCNFVRIYHLHVWFLKMLSLVFLHISEKNSWSCNNMIIFTKSDWGSCISNNKVNIAGCILWNLAFFDATNTDFVIVKELTPFTFTMWIFKVCLNSVIIFMINNFSFQ